MTTENVNPEADQDKNGKDLDPVKLKEMVDSLLAEKDKLSIELRGLKSGAGEGLKLQKQLDTAITEKSQLMALVESMKAESRDKELSTHLKTALESAGAKSVTTAMKLIDRSKVEFDKDGQVVQKSIDDAIEAVKVSDAILFGEPAQADGKKGEVIPQPNVQRAAPASGGKSDYESELAVARAKHDGGKAVIEVLRKYQKI